MCVCACVRVCVVVPFSTRFKEETSVMVYEDAKRLAAASANPKKIASTLFDKLGRSIAMFPLMQSAVNQMSEKSQDMKNNIPQIRKCYKDLADVTPDVDSDNIRKLTKIVTNLPHVLAAAVDGAADELEDQALDKIITMSEALVGQIEGADGSGRDALESILRELKDLVSIVWRDCKTDQRIAVQLAELTKWDQKLDAEKRQGKLGSAIEACDVTTPATITRLEETLRLHQPMHVETKDKADIYKIIVCLLDLDSLFNNVEECAAVLRQAKTFQRFLGTSATTAVTSAIECFHLIQETKKASATVNLIVDGTNAKKVCDDKSANKLLQSLDRNFQQLSKAEKTLSTDFNKIKGHAMDMTKVATASLEAYAKVIYAHLNGSLNDAVSGITAVLDGNANVQLWLSAGRDCVTLDDLMGIFDKSLSSENSQLFEGFLERLSSVCW